MNDKKTSTVITPEIIETIAKNAKNLKTLIEFENEKIELDYDCFRDKDCCCPKFLQFNFLLCDVYIKNDNAECK